MRYSIIICTYNRAAYLGDTIDSILGNVDSGIDYEIVIVNNNSTDATASIIAKYGTIPTVKSFLEEKQGLSNARNRGINESTGDVLIFLDDDIALHPSYMKKCRQCFEDEKQSIVGGKVLPFQVDIPAWLPAKYYYLVSVFDLGDEPHYVDKLMGANYAMTRSVAERVGFYNPELGRKGSALLGGEEIDYLNRCSSAGYKILYDPQLVVFHKINEKLNQKYVYDYALLLGKSEALIDASQSKMKVFSKTLKSILAISLQTIISTFVSDPKRKTHLNIIGRYGVGYIKR